MWYFQFLIYTFSLFCCQNALLRRTQLLLLYSHHLFIYNFQDLPEPFLVKNNALDPSPSS